MPSTTMAPQQQQVKAQQIFADPESYATTLLALFIDRYGTEGLTWHPTTIRTQLANDFGVEMLQINLDKLMAGIAILTTDYFFKDLPRFCHLCCVLSGSEFDPTSVELPDALEAAWGITEALLLSPPEEEEPFCDDIRHFLGKMLIEEGYIVPPDVLRIALDANLADQVSYDYADDPELQAELFKTQQSKTADVNAVIRDGLQELLGQIQSLPLEHGDTSKLFARLKGQLQAART